MPLTMEYESSYILYIYHLARFHHSYLLRPIPDQGLVAYERNEKKSVGGER